MVVISLSGKKHSGKSTVAELISQHVNHNCETVAWADALKVEVANALGITRMQLDLEKERFRLILQGWGTDFRRKQDPNYWIKQVAKRIVQSSAPLFIIHDTRFMNELQHIKDIGGYCINVIRPDAFNEDTHQSEIELDGCTLFERTIVNDGTIEQLEAKVKILMIDLKL